MERCLPELESQVLESRHRDPGRSKAERTPRRVREQEKVRKAKGWRGEEEQRTVCWS